MNAADKIFYELRPIMLAAVGAFAIMKLQSNLLVSAGYVLLFCSGIVMGLRLQYRKSKLISKDVREYFSKSLK